MNQKLSSVQFCRWVRAFNSRSARRWNTHNLEAFVQGYAEDALMITNDSRLLKGRAQIFAHYRTLYPYAHHMGAVSFPLKVLRFPQQNQDTPVTMAVGIVWWKHTALGKMERGYSKCTYELSPAGEIHITVEA